MAERKKANIWAVQGSGEWEELCPGALREVCFTWKGLRFWGSGFLGSEVLGPGLSLIWGPNGFPAPKNREKKKAHGAQIERFQEGSRTKKSFLPSLEADSTFWIGVVSSDFEVSS